MSTQTVTLAVEGMTCQACASRIEKVLNKKPAVNEAVVNFASETAQVRFDDSQASTADIMGWVAKTGFTASLLSAHAKDAHQLDSKASLPSVRLWLIWVCALPFFPSMVAMLFGWQQFMLPVWLQFGLASVVQWLLAIPFYKSAWGSVKGRLANMDVLVSLGTVTIWAYSTVMWLYVPQQAHQHIYFEASVMVIAFISLGKWLEVRTKKNSLDSVKLLLELTPKQVQVFKANQWQCLTLAEVQIGDSLKAKQGERIAADGTIHSGEAWFNESHLTGESRLVHKVVGDNVLAGALLDNGSVVYQVEQLGSRTLLGDMMQALSEAQGSKAPLARIADKVAGVFVPTVVVISLFTFVLTWVLTHHLTTAVVHAVAVLVIACPCALGLATPAAIMVGIGRAAKAGIWFKDASQLEAAANIDTLVLDKTGTLTQGKPKIVATWLQPRLEVLLPDTSLADTPASQLLLQLAASVEAMVSHPLADAIVEAANQQHITLLPVQAVTATVGSGVQAQYNMGSNTYDICLGTPDFVGLQLPNELFQQPNSPWQVASLVAVAVNQVPVGAFAIADGLKADSQQAIQALQNQGIDVVIMSGDRQMVVDHVAAQLGINANYAFGELSPRDKAKKVGKLVQAGRKVAMVGDGVNDAPALAAATVSFAMNNGTDVAKHTASATLMQHTVMQTVQALNIANATVKNIKQNLFFAFIYNIIGIPLAAIGMLTPVIAGAAMAASSVSVLFNALRLKRIK